MKKIVVAIAFLSLAACEDNSETDGVDQSSVTETAAAPGVNETTLTPSATPSAPPLAPAAAPTPAALPAAADGTPFEDLAGKLGVALCDRIFSCCGPSEAMTLVLGPLLTRDNCPALAPFYFGDYFKKYTLSLVEKRVTYFPDRVEACLQRLTGRTCAQFGASLYPAVTSYPYSPYYPYGPSTLPPAAFSCEELFAPNKTPGELCQNDYECVNGFCVNTLGADRRCQALSQVGQSCQSYTPSRCAPGLYCASGLCRTVGKEGESCFDTYSTTACETGLYCGSVYPSPATCRPKLADGSVCSYGLNCQSGRCEYNTGLGYTCMPAVQPPVTPPLACTGPA